MKLIEKNPFRILGLPVNASEKEIAKRVSDLETYTEMGITKNYDSDLNVLAPLERTPELVKEASQKIEQPKNKFYQSLWWFWPNNSVDELAIDVLQDGNSKKALSLWQDAIKNTEPNKRNISNFKNLGLLALWLSVKGNKISKDNFGNGLKFTGQFMDSRAFTAYQSVILKDSTIYNLKDSTGLFVDELYQELGASFENGSAINEKEFINFIRDFPSSAKNNIKESLINTPVNHIEKEIKSCQVKRERQPSKAAKHGIELNGTVTDNVKALKQVLSVNDMEFQMISDKLAEEILQCSITYFNYHVNNSTNTDPGDDAFICANLAKDLAIGQQTKNRIKENMPVLRDWIENKEERQKFREVERENNFILNKLQNLNNSSKVTLDGAKDLINSCKPKLRVLEQKLGSNNQAYKDATNAVVNTALNIIIAVVNDNSPTYQSYQGDPIVQNYIQIVKKAHTIMQSMHHMGMSGDVKKRYNENQKIILNTKNEINKAEGGCYIATMVYGNYDHPKVKILRNFRDNVLSNFFLGRCFMKFYYMYSPRFVEQVKEYPKVNKAIKLLLERTLIKWNQE